MPNVQIHLLPALIAPGQLSGGTAVVIDVLRASTTIIHAIAAGAQAVVPCLTVEDAFAVAERFPTKERVLGGERHGQLIDGFDLDNSPLRYTGEVVGGRTVIFTTTNGTRALLACSQAKTVLVGAFVNLSAVVEALRLLGDDVHFVCAGTDGQLTAEDILFAGAAAAKLLSTGTEWRATDVQTRMALDFWAANSSPEKFAETFAESLGAKNLLELGMHADVQRCQQRDLFKIVPRWDAASNRIGS